MKIGSAFLRSFHVVNKGNVSQGQNSYHLNDLFETIVEIFGINLATQIVIDSGNLEWVFQFAGQFNENPELTTDLRKKLAQFILESKHENYSYRFFRCIRRVSNEIRRKLLDSSFVKDQLEKEKLLQQPAIGF